MNNLCKKYLAQVSRLYGQACADNSVCFQCDGRYWVGVEEPASPHTAEELEGMITVLSARKPSVLAGSPRVLSERRQV